MTATTTEETLDSRIQRARADLNAWTEEVVQWHFDPETGCPFWLEWAEKQDWDPRVEVRGFSDLAARFPHFQDEWLRDLQPEVWVPKPYKGRPFNIFETGGTTGMPKQRIGWEDYKIDYSEFSETLNDEHFPRNHYWLMVGPTGPRRLRLAIEHLANIRGCSCYFVDLDPRWVKKLIAEKQGDQAHAYMAHARHLLRHSPTQLGESTKSVVLGVKHATRWQDTARPMYYNLSLYALIAGALASVIFIVMQMLRYFSVLSYDVVRLLKCGYHHNFFWYNVYLDTFINNDKRLLTCSLLIRYHKKRKQFFQR